MNMKSRAKEAKIGTSYCQTEFQSILVLLCVVARTFKLIQF